ncbi:CSEP0486 putative effector protein [Blumeria hordei DH14]|uniref:CSEP0264 putative effector protein n=1 Tax=Blumeria graminis f. sp. hordei (strain DH14) TaxID=546991 RepID=N1JJX4_BLUG1|nr:CSEP0264 putative effector protein [Blumeria hordei DH14]CCU83226.1 CSEP0486 putative effector protein [Blumeria hordei DH14]
MRPFQLLPAITIFISLEILGVAGYWDCDDYRVPDKNVRDAAVFAFSKEKGSFHGYPITVHGASALSRLGSIRKFPVDCSEENWQGEHVNFYVLTNRDRKFIQVVYTFGDGGNCAHVQD